MDLWDIEMEPEVRAWLESLPKRQFGHVLAFAEITKGSLVDAKNDVSESAKAIITVP